MSISFRLIDFNVYNEEVDLNNRSDSGSESESSDDGKKSQYVDKKQFIIQMFGMNEKGKTFCVYIDDYEPFFYMQVGDNWSKRTKEVFLEYIKAKISKGSQDGGYYRNSITTCKLIKREKLYGFDNGKKFKFVLMKFKNTQAMNKVKNLFYEYVEVMGDDGKKERTRRLIDGGLRFRDTNIRLYEANIPPLLRFFHIKDISPSGWISISKNNLDKHHVSLTTCDYEYTASYKSIISLNKRETKVPYKICSFDIEASSSHGDFPLAVKNYKKLTTNILDFWDAHDDIMDLPKEEQMNTLGLLIRAAFGHADCHYIYKVYPKRSPKNLEHVNKLIDRILYSPVRKLQSASNRKNTIEDLLGSSGVTFGNGNSNFGDDDGVDEGSNKSSKTSKTKYRKPHLKSQTTIIDLLNDDTISREDKLIEITILFDSVLPKLEGDKVTFIGSTFIKYGEDEPYLNHCIALDTCDDIPGAEIEQYDTEKQVLLAWTDLIQRENPDIIIGYNIFGFDYKFMFNRAQENGMDCVKNFLKLSRNKDEICGQRCHETGNYKIQESSLSIASGVHNLEFVKMTGRIQVDLYNYFRRDYNLTSYKLDYVSGFFIGDKVKKLDYVDVVDAADAANSANTHSEHSTQTIVYSKNLTGLKPGNYIHFEEIGHSSEYYQQGAKFKVVDVDEINCIFKVDQRVEPDMTKVVKWCLAKDDVTPQDIFRMTNEGPSERAIIAKYCIQDCNLVHHLMRKIDVLTGFIEMANICSVPIDFIVMRGQGIKLFSFIAKKCREAKTLIPVLQKKDDGGYEGAIVLDPKCGLYLDEPVACVDYSSLYPSSMISENLSHDSKVWTREYDLQGKIVKETGARDSSGNYIYDNLPGFKYVDVNYDTYEYIRKNPKAKAVKTKCGKKLCRFAQFPDGKLAIMPRILKELLAARKATRASAKWKTIKTSIGDFTGLILDKTDEHITLKDKDGKIKIIEQESIQDMEDTFNDFMKNVLDKRQLAIKVTANSLYGQCGARTSSFYEKDVAASTTATGRKLLTYGKRIIEEVYGDRVCETKYGTVKSNAEYIYGDSVTGDTPIILRDAETHDIIVKRIDEINEDIESWSLYEEFKPFDSYKSNRRNKQQYKTDSNLQIWTASGWSNIKRVIRHKCNKKIYRVATHNSVVDVTEDHSLLDESGTKIKPLDCKIGTKLLSNELKNITYTDVVFNDKYFNSKIEAAEFMYKFGNQSNLDIKLDETKDNKFKVYFENKTDVSLNAIKSIHVLHDKYDDFVYDIETEDGTFNTGFPLIVKNTDSVFMSFKLTDVETGEKIVGKEALKHTIELAKEAGKLATTYLKAPHDLEYEKTFMPFCLLSKKRYVGMLYEEDPDKCYRKSMGIVLKRRDNAPIVKDVYGGIIDILMKDQNVNKAIDFTKNCLNDIVEEKYPLDKLIITKSLNGFYKKPQQIAHKVLADRMTKRDPGNKPGPGDRIPFVYIQTKHKVKLQGEKIEHPDYIRQHNLKPDYSHYITNQIMKPIQQVFALVLEDIPAYKKKVIGLQRKIKGFKRKYKDNLEKQNHYEQKYRNDEVQKLIFDDSLRKCLNAKNNQISLMSFFG